MAEGYAMVTAADVESKTPLESSSRFQRPTFGAFPSSSRKSCKNDDLLTLL
jgi:hypothetical protein